MRIPGILYQLGLLSAALLTGCSSEEPLTRLPATEEAGEMWLALSVSGPEASAITRASANSDYETTIKDLVVYITEKDGTDIVSVGFPIKFPTSGTEEITDVDLVHDGNGKYVARMPLTNKLTPGTEYDLHVAANLPGRDDILAAVWTSGIDEITGLTVNHSAVSEWKHAAVQTSGTGIPMSSSEAVTFKIEDKDYPRTAPIANDGSEAKTQLSVTLTRLYARVDYKDISGNDNTYAVDNNNQVTVTFTAIKPMNVAQLSYLRYNAESSGQVNNPSGKTLAANASSFAFATATADSEGFIPQFYLTENTPAVDDATFANLTYVELTAKLSPVEDKCPAELRNVLNGLDKDGNVTEDHPDLWYYDDGTFQSTLTLTAPDEETASWHKVEYSTTAKGYYLTYRHAIRHDAGNDSGGNDLNADDGAINTMEYGIVRNTIYRLSIEKVASLPHPWTTSTPIESGRQDILISIKPAEWTQYHRSGLEIEY